MFDKTALLRERNVIFHFSDFLRYIVCHRPSINNRLYHHFPYSAASWYKYEYTFDLTWGNEIFDSYDSHIADGAAVCL